MIKILIIVQIKKIKNVKEFLITYFDFLTKELHLRSNKK